MQPWEHEQKLRILEQHPTCYICGRRTATQLHHAIERDTKRHHKELTTPENLMEVCETCHTSLAQTANGIDKRKFALRQIGLGLDVVGWYRGLPTKIKNEKWLFELEE